MKTLLKKTLRNWIIGYSERRKKKGKGVRKISFKAIRPNTYDNKLERPFNWAQKINESFERGNSKVFQSKYLHVTTISSQYTLSFFSVVVPLKRLLSPAFLLALVIPTKCSIFVAFSLVNVSPSRSRKFTRSVCLGQMNKCC